MPARRSHRPRPFRPHFTLSLFYLAGFFVLFALLLILPEMLDALAKLPPDANAELEGASIARRIAAPRLLVAFFLSAISFGVSAYYEILPGMRRP
jgi:hypothetical protein